MSIKARIEVDNIELKKGLKDAENQSSQSMNKIQKTVEGASSMFGKLASSSGKATQAMSEGIKGVTGLLGKLGPVGILAAAGVTTIGGAAIGAFSAVNKLSTKINNMAKSAKSVNMTTNQYVALQYAGKRAGVEMEDLISIISKLEFALSKASTGEKKVRDGFYALNLSWREMSQLSPDKQIIALADAFTKLREEGKNIPTEVYDILNRKDVRNMQKLSNEDIGRLVAEAGAIGLHIDESMIKNAEAIQDAYGDISQSVVVWATKLKLVKEAMETIKNIAKDTAASMIDDNGDILPEYADRFETYKTVAERLAKEGKFTEEQMRELVKARKLDEIDQNEEVRLRRVGTYTDKLAEINEKVNKMTAKNLQYEFNKINFRKPEANLKQALINAVKVLDSRFKNGVLVAQKEDAKSFIKSDDEIAIERIQDEAEDVNRELEKASKNYDNILNKIGLEYDVDKKIKDLNAQINRVSKGKMTTISKTLEIEMRENSYLMRRKALEIELKKIREAGRDNINNSAIDLLGRSGADTTMLKQLMTSFKSIGKESNVMDGVIHDINRYKLSRQNPDLFPNEIDKLMNDIILETPGAIAETDPKMFYNAINQIASHYSKGKMTLDLSVDERESLENAEREYNFIAEKLKLEPINISLVYNAEDPFEFLYNSQELEKAKKAFGDIDKLAKEIADTEQKISEVTKQHGESNKVVTDLKAELNALNEKYHVIKEIDRASKIVENYEIIAATLQNNDMAQDARIANAAYGIMQQAAADDKEIQIMQAKIKGNEKLVSLLEKQNMLRKAGLPVNMENLEIFNKAMTIARREEYGKKAANLQNNLFEQTKDNQVNILKLAGRNKEAERLQMRMNAEDIAGRRLNPYERDLVDRLADINSRINAGYRFPQIKDAQIYTNELASKGGFSSSVAVEKDTAGKTQTRLQEDIRKLLAENNKLQNRIAESVIIR